MTREHTLDEWVRIVAARKAAVGDFTPTIKRTRERDPAKTAVLVDLAVARMRRRFPTLFEVLGERHWRLRPARRTARSRPTPRREP
jgi:hypothetical protein